MLRYLLFLLGVLLALPLLAITALALGLPVTIWGIGYLSGGALLAAGLILVPWAGRNSLWLAIIGLMIIVSVASIRLILVGQGTTAKISMITLPESKEARWVNTLVDEQDSLILGEALFHMIGGDSANEHKGISFALYADYSEIRTGQRVFPSPFISTYLGLQGSTHFDAVVIKPESNRPPEFAFIFLHGYMGNVTAQCWEIAQAVKNFGAVTVCPSTSWRGDWWRPQGQAILEETFEYLRGQGIQKFYLSGFSNGGISIGRLAPGLKNEHGLAGLILIDGFDNSRGLKETGLPTLLLQGRQDERIPAAYARQIAEEIGRVGTYVEVEGDHFLIMKHPLSVQNPIAKWLGGQETEN